MRTVLHHGMASTRRARRCAGACAAVVLALAPMKAHAADIVGAAHDPIRDELTVEIAYRGITPGHAFSLSWGPCRADEGGALSTVARLIDSKGGEFAREDYRVRQRFSLEGLECRPAVVTLRLGAVSNMTVSVPALDGP